MKKDILQILFYLLVIVFAIFISKTIFEAIYYSDMPTWLKYILLQ